MTRTIPLTQGKVALVDAIDFRRVMTHKWHAFRNHDRGWYARTKIAGRRVFLHTFLAGAPLVDHKDGDGLNNTRLNLRPATPKQNAQNRTTKAAGTSRYRGVYLLRPGVYRALIGVNGKQKSLGCFRDETTAAKAYDDAAKAEFGEFASLNFPEVSRGRVAECVAPGLCPVHQYCGAGSFGDRSPNG
jgi:hypothetical protein